MNSATTTQGLRDGGAGSYRKATSTVCLLSILAFTSGLPMFGQYPAPQYPQPQYPAPQYPQQVQQYPQQQYPAAQYPQQTYPAPQQAQQSPNQPLMTPEQLDNLVAPIALYPDPLLGQVLAASTYPLEVVEAQQWLQQNGNLRGADLLNAARQQNWDPSVQALVAFPDVVTMLNRDVRWTTDLGNAFLAQQADVMGAVQRMRVRAQQNGRLSSNADQTVTTQEQNGQSAVVIEPANPQVIYVPVYNPDYVWGPPVYGYYPPLWYPPVGFGFGFGPGIFMDAFFPGWLGIGWGGWGLGWGWGCGWFGGGLFLNAGFFNHWGFHGFYGSRWGGGGFGGRYAWAHDPYHRAGVGYANRGVESRFNNSRYAAGRYGQSANFAANRSFAGAASRGFDRGASAGARGFAPSNRASGAASSSGFGGQRFGGASSSGYGGQRFGGASPAARGFAPSAGSQSYRGSSGAPSSGAERSFSAPRSYGGGGFSGSSRSFSGGGGGFSGNARSFSGGGGGFSGGHASGGGGGHSFGGGGSHGGGGGHGGGGHR